MQGVGASPVITSPYGALDPLLDVPDRLTTFPVARCLLRRKPRLSQGLRKDASRLTTSGIAFSHAASCHDMARASTAVARCDSCPCLLPPPVIEECCPSCAGAAGPSRCAEILLLIPYGLIRLPGCYFFPFLPTPLPFLSQSRFFSSCWILSKALRLNHTIAVAWMMQHLAVRKHGLSNSRAQGG